MKRLVLCVTLLTLTSACGAGSRCANLSSDPSETSGFLPVGADALSVFDGKTLSYVYENGKSFTNVFEGDTRISKVKRGTLREKVLVTHLGYQRYLITWKDDRMGMVVQVVDLENRTVLAAVPLPSGPKVWTAKIRRFEPASP